MDEFGDEVDRTEELAATLDMSAESFARVFGAGWRESPGPGAHDFDADPSGGLMAVDVTPWFIAGEPPQLMARVFYHGVFLAIPKGDWADGTHNLVYWPADQRYARREDFGTSQVEQIVEELLRCRRADFRYCQYCRGTTPPELRVGDSCMGCAQRWEGIVF